MHTPKANDDSKGSSCPEQGQNLAIRIPSHVDRQQTAKEDAATTGINKKHFRLTYDYYRHSLLANRMHK
jgi:hypothetical protein